MALDFSTFLRARTPNYGREAQLAQVKIANDTRNAQTEAAIEAGKLSRQKAAALTKQAEDQQAFIQDLARQAIEMKQNLGEAANDVYVSPEMTADKLLGVITTLGKRQRADVEAKALREKIGRDLQQGQDAIPAQQSPYVNPLYGFGALGWTDVEKLNQEAPRLEYGGRDAVPVGAMRKAVGDAAAKTYEDRLSATNGVEDLQMLSRNIYADAIARQKESEKPPTSKTAQKFITPDGDKIFYLNPLTAEENSAGASPDWQVFDVASGKMIARSKNPPPPGSKPVGGGPPDEDGKVTIPYQSIPTTPEYDANGNPLPMGLPALGDNPPPPDGRFTQPPTGTGGGPGFTLKRPPKDKNLDTIRLEYNTVMESIPIPVGALAASKAWDAKIAAVNKVFARVGKDPNGKYYNAITPQERAKLGDVLEAAKAKKKAADATAAAEAAEKKKGGGDKERAAETRVVKLQGEIGKLKAEAAQVRKTLKYKGKDLLQPEAEEIAKGIEAGIQTKQRLIDVDLKNFPSLKASYGAKAAPAKKQKSFNKPGDPIDIDEMY